MTGEELRQRLREGETLTESTSRKDRNSDFVSEWMIGEDDVSDELVRSALKGLPLRRKGKLFGDGAKGSAFQIHSWTWPDAPEGK